MTVYVVEGGDYEDRKIIGVYGTASKADDKKKEYTSSNVLWGGAVHISEWEIE